MSKPHTQYIGMGCIVILSLCVMTQAQAQTEKPLKPKIRQSPWSARGLANGQIPLSEEEGVELEALEEAVNIFEKRAQDFREATRQLIQYKYRKKRDYVFEAFEKEISQMEMEQRQQRLQAIATFEKFLKLYPKDERYTPDVMFRLSELYFERSYDVFVQERKKYEIALDAWQPETGELEPVEPIFHFEPTIKMMQRLITEYPNYRYLDGAYYLLGYCLSEQGEEERAVDVYVEMVERFAKSRFAAEVWTRIGEYYFAANELERALNAYRQVLGHYNSPFYDKALYKLAWTHYRLADPEIAPEQYQKAVIAFIDLLEFNEKTKAEGRERGGELRKEAIQYIAISYSDDNWGSLEKALSFLNNQGERPFDREILVAIGDLYFDQTRFQDAIAAYLVVQKRFPLHAEAPRVQEKIINSYERDRDFEAATLARQLFGKVFNIGSPWYEAHQNNSEVMTEVKELSQKSLYAAAIFYHEQAQKYKAAKKITQATAAYSQAAFNYGAYLKQFPHDRQVYELSFYYAESLYYSLQFDEAAEQYKRVRDSTADDKFLEASAFSAFLALEKAVQLAEDQGKIQPTKVRKSTDRWGEESTVPKEIPLLKREIVGACDRYAVLLSQDTSVPKIMYKAAEIFYVYDHFDEARRRFRLLLDRYPKSKVSEYGANLVIESYLTQKNYGAVEKFSRELLARSSLLLGRDAFASELVKFKTGAMFKMAEEMESQAKYEEAANLYLRLIEENAETQFVDSALNNAAVCFEKAKRYDSASKLYERLVRDYPNSPLADTALFRVGLNAERFFEFEKAIRSYLHLVNVYPKSERRADAIYNAALSLENTQNYEKAARQYQRYCTLFPDREDAPEVCFRAGVVYEKMGNPSRVISTYMDTIKKYRKDPRHTKNIVQANLKIAQTYASLKETKDAQKYYELVIKTHRQSKTTEDTSAFAAEAQFQLVEQDFEGFRRIQIFGDGKQQKRALQNKARKLKDLETAYKSVLKFKHIDWTLASLFRIGQLYLHFSESILEAPCPPDVKRAARKGGWTVEEVCDQYRVALEDRAINVEDKAVQAFETTLQKARELQLANNWTKKTLVELNKLRRREWPLQKDAKIYLDPNMIDAPLFIHLDGQPLATLGSNE